MSDRSTGFYTFVFVYSLLAIASLFVAWHVLKIARARRASPVRALDTEAEEPLESNFWPWYDALLAQDDFSYAEAKMLYRLLDHEDVYRRQEPSTARQIDDMPL